MLSQIAKTLLVEIMEKLVEEDAIEPLQENVPDVVFVAGYSSPDVKKEIFEDIEAALAAARVFIYTPVMESGTSYAPTDPAMRFHEVFGYFPRLTNVNNVLQMLHRARSLIDNKVTIYLPQLRTATSEQGDEALAGVGERRTLGHLMKDKNVYDGTQWRHRDPLGNYEILSALIETLDERFMLARLFRKLCDCGYAPWNIRGDKAFPKEALPQGGIEITDSQQWLTVERSKLQPNLLSTEAYHSTACFAAEAMFRDGWTLVTNGYPLMQLQEALSASIPTAKEWMALYAAIFDM